MPFGRHLTASEKSTSLSGVLSFLSDNGVRYRVCHFSASSTDAEIEQEIARLGMGLLEAIPLDIQGEGPILAIIPSSLALHLTEFSKRLAPRLLRPLSPNEIKESLSLNHPTSVIPPLGGLFDLEIFLSPLIEQQHSVGFFVESRNTLITLAPSEFRRTFYDGSAIPVPTTPKYRAYASPGRKDNVRCILGVSLENSDFHTSKLITITDWISKHYAESIVMVGDGLHRITLQLDSKASDSETLEHSKWLARDFVYSQLSVFRLNDSRCHFTFVFCSEVQGTARYLAYYGQLVDLFRDDEEFRNSVRAFSLEFLRRKPEREHQEQHVEMSCRYLVEELAIICCLAEDGPSTFVYPGSLTILREIADGKHRSVPACLLRIDYVELKLKSLKK